MKHVAQMPIKRGWLVVDREGWLMLYEYKPKYDKAKGTYCTAKGTCKAIVQGVAIGDKWPMKIVRSTMLEFSIKE